MVFCSLDLSHCASTSSGRSKLSFSSIMDVMINSLASRVVESNRSRETEDGNDDAIFAELEAEIENADLAAFREHGLEQLRLQCVLRSLFELKLT